jgi:hypothetical protein
VAAEDKKWRESRKPTPPSDFDRTLLKELDPKRKAKKNKGVPQLGETSRPLPPRVTNEYGSNIEYMNFPTDQEVDFTELLQYYAISGVDMDKVVFETALIVDKWRKYEHGQSLWNPDTIHDLGTEMYALNTWYIKACARGQKGFNVRIRDQWGTGDDLM